MSTNPRADMSREIRLRLGEGMIDLELDPEHVDIAIDAGLAIIRRDSDGGGVETHMKLSIEPGVNQYVLPNEVLHVRKVWRRTLGHSTGQGSQFDPFEAAFNNAYLLHGQGAGGGLATWDFFAQHQETLQKVFAGHMDFIWNPDGKTLELIRNPRGHENVILSVYVAKPEDVILTGQYTRSWVRSWAVAECKEMLGQARGKFPGGLPGPNGNVTLKGDALIQEAQQEKEALMARLRGFETGNQGMPFLIG